MSQVNLNQNFLYWTGMNSCLLSGINNCLRSGVTICQIIAGFGLIRGKDENLSYNEVNQGKSDLFLTNSCLAETGFLYKFYYLNDRCRCTSLGIPAFSSVFWWVWSTIHWQFLNIYILEVICAFKNLWFLDFSLIFKVFWDYYISMMKSWKYSCFFPHPPHPLFKYAFRFPHCMPISPIESGPW